MQSPEEEPAARDLLRHAQWIRSLARGLVGDEATAEDVVQETWVAALTHAPAEPRLRSWLRQVVRNFARQHHRSSGRRRAREQAVEGPNGLPGPEEVLERLELEQRLSHELAQLDEPFRSTLVHRYYDDLEPSEIAARLGLPSGTVRWRLKRGLEILRARLDAEHDGDRSAWCLALLPLTRIEEATAASAGVALVAVPGLVLMNALKVTAVAAAVLVVAVGLAVSGLVPETLVPWAPSEAAAPVGFKPLEPEVAASVEEELQTPEPVAVRAEVATPASPTAAEPTAPALEPFELDAFVVVDGAPLPGAQVVARIDGETRAPVRSGRDGYALVTVPDLGQGTPVTVEFHASGYASRQVETYGQAGASAHLGRVELEPGGVVSGRVVDESGRGLAGCTITLADPGVPKRMLERERFAHAGFAVPFTATDELGEFSLTGVPVGTVRLWARADGRLANFTPPIEVRSAHESFGVEIVLAPLGRENLVRGIVVGPDGTPIPYAGLQYRHSSKLTGSTYSGDQEADEAGRFEFLLMQDARLSLTASDPAGHLGQATVADIGTGSLDLVLRLVEERTVGLVVTSSNGSPVTRYAVAVLDPSGEQLISSLPDREHPEGRSELPLPTGRFMARITAPGHAELDLGPLDPGHVGPELEAVLLTLPGLRGVVLRGGEPVGSGIEVSLHAGIDEHTTVHQNGFRMRMLGNSADQTRTDENGRFLLTPRAAGSYYVRAEPVGGVPAEYGPFMVVGDLSGPELELNLGVGGAIEGRVVLSGGFDPSGSIVGVSRGDGGARTQRVGTDGTYRFEGLIAGPWRVELREEELQPGRTTVSTMQSGGRAKPFEDWSCTVFDGETTYFDLRDDAEESWAFTGRLTVDGKGARGWTATLAPSGSFEEDGPRVTLGEDGSFSLPATQPGRQRLILHGQRDDVGEQLVIDDVDVSHGSWSRDLRTGTLVLQGLASWDGQGVPAAAIYWKGEGDLFCLIAAAPDESGVTRIEQVPAGACRLVEPNRTFDPEQWTVLREFTIEQGGETAIDLR